MMPMRDRSSRRVFVVAGAALTASAMPLPSLLAAAPASDRELLAILIAVEQVQIARYTALLDQFDDTSFLVDGMPEGARAVLAAALRGEEEHLRALGGEATVLAESIAAKPSPGRMRDALGDIAALEQFATAAYAGVIPRIGRQGLVPELVGIHSVEARHAAWLASIVGDEPFPLSIDVALPPGEVLAQLQAISGASPPAATPAAGDEEEIAQLIPVIAEDLGVAEDEVTVIYSEARDWPDSSLGCPRDGEIYLEVITPGYLIGVGVQGEPGSDGEEITFHADRRGNVVRCP